MYLNEGVELWLSLQDDKLRVSLLLFCSWDEWVPETRILKINNANLQKQKELQQQNPLVEYVDVAMVTKILIYFLQETEKGGHKEKG